MRLLHTKNERKFAIRKSTSGDDPSVGFFIRRGLPERVDGKAMRRRDHDGGFSLDTRMCIEGNDRQGLGQYVFKMWVALSLSRSLASTNKRTIEDDRPTEPGPIDPSLP